MSDAPQPDQAGSPPVLVDHFFRHQYGELVARLARRVGVQHVEAVEDAVQVAMQRALEGWGTAGPPEQPAAWLYRVAHNRLVDTLRQQRGRTQILDRQPPRDEAPEVESEPRLGGELSDDLLSMLFVCCDARVPADSQLVFALKILCGFGVGEIAQRLFLSEANVYKRLSRARSQLREGLGAGAKGLDVAPDTERVPAVHAVLYLLFTEGHLSSHPELSIRSELCDEAIRLAEVLAAHPVGGDPQTFALVALMYLHRARLDGRQSESGGLLLLEEQRRERWDRALIARGLDWLGRSAQGPTLSRYHLEAAIAAEHCMAPSFAETRWAEVARNYALLERVSPSSLHRLNRAVAVAEAEGAAAGLALLSGFEPPSWLMGSYLWSAVLADLHRRAGDASAASRHRELALELAPSAAVRELLERRLAVAQA